MIDCFIKFGMLTFSSLNNILFNLKLYLRKYYLLFQFLCGIHFHIDFLILANLAFVINFNFKSLILTIINHILLFFLRQYYIPWLINYN